MQRDNEKEMAAEGDKHILMTGQTFTVPESERRQNPRLTIFPMSLNSQKAHGCIRFSSLKYEDVELNLLNYPEDNQTLDYARLNPNMTIPTLEIDDKIITDSIDIQRYLSEKYPGKGDANAKKEDIASFIDTVCAWDEYLFSYRAIPKLLGEGMHIIRLVWQVDAVNDAVRDGALDEVLRDGQTVRQAYVKKIAQTRALIDVGVGEETPDLVRRMEENGKLLEAIFREASVFRSESGGPFLLGTELSSADAYFAAVVARVEGVDKPKLNSFFERFEGTQEWWQNFKEQKESDVFFKYNKPWVASKMVLSGKPIKLLGYKLGLYKPGKLPDNIEKDVQVELKRLKDAYFA